MAIVPCPACGASVLSIASRCPSCHRDIDLRATAAATRPSRGRGRPSPLGGLVALGALAVTLVAPWMLVGGEAPASAPPPAVAGVPAAPVEAGPPAAAPSAPMPPTAMPPAAMLAAAVSNTAGPSPAARPAAAPPSGTTLQTVQWVNLRRAPSREADVVLVIPPEAAVLADSSAVGWRRVRYGDVEGWVDPRLLERSGS
jgi:hypothetical protein